MQKADIKKVLILGGSNQMVQIVETAKNMGFYTIVSDHAIGAPAKKCADSSHDISPADVLRLMEIGEAEKLDGIIAVFDDVTTWNALALCKRLRVPFYASKEQLESSSTIDKFMDYCRTFNISVIDEATLAGTVEEMNGKVLEFPVLLNSYTGKQRAYATI
ncbi:hypothetical protein QWY16_14650 [Planococcus shenhongbingii]|uniref:ATP-grasp domain-containing protein n=1 Tax=Planococcus shenhongbingii TaxID=3058398 RepID=A0ABT8N9J8_9BACL|nr:MULTISPECIES: hypothetical protein [unclassified Planococcus (in: firmicutes)]MDN7244572.1 hypothetical protein [Planococcus sp. N017]WKA57726.1 hypothetical protein QWY16_14650 [Planococcus sp. N016]